MDDKPKNPDCPCENCKCGENCQCTAENNCGCNQ